MRAAPLQHVAVTAVALSVAGSAAGMELRDLFFGEALYHTYQEHYFEALERLDAEIAQHYRVDEPELDSLHPHIGHAEFCVGDFELNYRMHHRAGRAIKAVLEADVPEPVRNEAAYRLARIHFQKGQPGDALDALEKIHGDVPEGVRNDVEFLRANVQMALGRPGDAVAVLRKLQGAPRLEGFSAYNLGIALLQDGRLEQAMEQLDTAGRVSGGDLATLSIRDKSNLVLGTLQFEASAFDRAAQSLDRVRLDGPFSNQALLRAGWSDVSAENFARAVVPWSLLAEREPTDAAVQEALLALPYAYSKLNVHGRAAVLYGRAVETFGSELVKLDASLHSIEAGEFLRALVREEIRQSKDWVIRLRRLPDAPETFYLMSLMASHDFQTALQNYLDLEDMRKKLVAWMRNLVAFEDLIRLRREYYEPLLPEVDRQFRKLDARMRLRLDQRERIEKRLQALLVDPRPDHLATAEERMLRSRLDDLETALGDAGDPDTAALRARLARLDGALTWRLETEYHQRLSDAHAHLRELNADVEALQAEVDAFVRVRQAATHGYVGWNRQIDRLRGRISDAHEGVVDLMDRQGEVLEAVAAEELKLRRERLVTYLNQARFAYADSYDRAAKAQAQ